MCFVTVRAEPPAVEISHKARAELGERIQDLENAIVSPRYTNNIANIFPALDVLMSYGQLLREEYEEFIINHDDCHAMRRQLQDMYRDTNIPQTNRSFISLVVASCNMHVFKIIGMNLNDVLVFAS